MRGSYELVVRNARVQFKLTIRRNITILRGNSATGKTTLIDMIADYGRDGEESGVLLHCDRPCIVLEGHDWQEHLNRISGSIVFVDEGNRFTAFVDFARTAAATDNYFVIATRDSLFGLPYSVTEIYGIGNDTRQRYQGVWRYYSSSRLLYATNKSGEVLRPDGLRQPGVSETYIPTLVVVEDSGAGFEFFSALFAKKGIACVSARGKANVYRTVCQASADERVLVIADGAAFGPELERLASLFDVRDMRLFLPESFEWLILRSGLVKSDELPSILENPANYIESHEYFSWERFFTACLVDMTRGTSLVYSKDHLADSYRQAKSMDSIAASVPYADGFDS